jgi:hypothetical protein
LAGLFDLEERLSALPNDLAAVTAHVRRYGRPVAVPAAGAA